VCKGCALRKYTKPAFLGSDRRATKILVLVHSFLCGSMLPLCLSGFEYYVTFIDDFLRKTWIYFKNTKSQIFNQFQ
jgi:hypothetical protein